MKIHTRFALLAATPAVLAVMWVGAAPAHACHTLSHCAQEQVESLVSQVMQEAGKVSTADTYACLVQGRTTTWSNTPGSSYTFVGPASCTRLDHDGAVDGQNDTQLFPSFPEEGDAEFELSGTHTADTLNTCTMHFDSVPTGAGLLRLDNNNDGIFDQTVSFPYEMDSVASQGVLTPNDAQPASAMKAYGAMNLLATDVIETPPPENGTSIGCLTAPPVALFIDGVLVVQNDNAVHQAIP